MADAARPPDPPPPHHGWPPPPGWGAPPPPQGGPPQWGQPWQPWGQPPARIGSGRFHAMGVGELLDAIFSLYRRNFLLIAAISAVVQVPYAVLQFVVFQLSGYSALRGPFASFTAPQPGQPLTQQQLQTLQSTLGGLLVASTILALVSLFVVLPLAEAAVTRAVSDRYLDRPASLASSYGAAIRRLGALIVQSLILLGGSLLIIALVAAFSVLLVFVGGAPMIIVIVILVIATVCGGIFVYVRTSFAPPAIVLESLSGWRGLKRSWQLTHGYFWRLFGIRLLIGLIAGIVSGVVTTLLTVAAINLNGQGQLILTQVASAFANVFIGPITYIAVTLLYYDTRIRKEAFDIQMLAESL